MKAPDFSNLDSIANEDPTKAQTTGRYVVVLQEGEFDEGVRYLRNEGFDVFVSEADDSHVPREDEIGGATAIGLATLSVAVVEGSAEQIARLQDATGDSSPILVVEPERIRRILPEPSPAMDSLAELEAHESSTVSFNTSDAGAPDEPLFTWGLEATRVINSKYSGAGVRVAILDTGIDLDYEADGTVRYHPDFADRTICTKSFVRHVASAKDGNGHGTHCVGTVCGARQPTVPPRYGIAFEAEIYVGKVINDAFIGADLWVIEGIEWAVRNGCQIVSMSFGGYPKKKDDPFSPAYEHVACRALKAGTIIVAAAGNDSGRPTDVFPINEPADSPSIIAVTAIDNSFALWPKSNAGINPNGGEINFAAPGVKIHSSWVPASYKTRSGTSMATPYVAGVAALYAEANPGVVGKDLWDLMTSRVRPLPLSPQDVGSGFIQAP